MTYEPEERWYQDLNGKWLVVGGVAGSSVRAAPRLEVAKEAATYEFA